MLHAHFFLLDRERNCCTCLPSNTIMIQCSVSIAQKDPVANMLNRHSCRGHEGPQREAAAAVGTTERNSAGSRHGGFDTPSRRPRPPLDAWGTPPSSSDTQEADGGGARGQGGRGRGGAVGGLLPPLTGGMTCFSVKSIAFWK